MFRNNMFSGGYQPIPQDTNQNNLILAFVQGEEGAKAFYLAPNQRAFLLDSDNDCFYVKTTDLYGMPTPLEIFDYQKRSNEFVRQKVQNNVEYVTKDEVKTMIQDALNTGGSESNGESTV